MRQQRQLSLEKNKSKNENWSLYCWKLLYISVSYFLYLFMSPLNDSWNYSRRLHVTHFQMTWVLSLSRHSFLFEGTHMTLASPISFSRHFFFKILDPPTYPYWVTSLMDDPSNKTKILYRFYDFFFRCAKHFKCVFQFHVCFFHFHVLSLCAWRSGCSKH